MNEIDEILRRMISDPEVSGELTRGHVAWAVNAGHVRSGAHHDEQRQQFNANPRYIGLEKPCRTCAAVPGQIHKCCPKCNASATGQEETERLFGFRPRKNLAWTLAPQSRCRACRAGRQRAKQEVTFSHTPTAVPVAAETPTTCASRHRLPHTGGKAHDAETLSVGPFKLDVLTHNTSEGISMIPAIDVNFVMAEDEAIVLAIALKHGDNTWVWGPSGTGKTSGIVQMAALTNWPVYRVNMSGDMSVDDFVGRTEVIIDKGTGQAVTKFVDGPLIQAMLHGGILLIDEISACPSHILLCLQAVLEHVPDVEAAWEAGTAHCRFVNVANGGEVIHAHKNFRIIVTDNTNGQGDVTGDFIGTQPMNEAARSRFTNWHSKQYPSREAWKKILISKTGVSNHVALRIVDTAIAINDGSSRLGSHRVTNNLVVNPRDALAIAKHSRRFGNTTVAWKIGFLNSIHPSDPDHQFLADLIKSSLGGA